MTATIRFPRGVAFVLAWLGVLYDVAAAVAARAVRRLLRGPAAPTWSWGMELRVVALRAFLTSIVERFDRETLRRMERRVDPPLPRPLRGNVSVHHGTIGGRPVESLRRVSPLRDWAVVLYLHGGGYVAGSPATHRHLTARIAWEWHAQVHALDYRLAPEHPFPAAVDDAEAAYRALLADGVDPRRLFIAGDSAGGGLTIAVLYRVRDRGLPMPAGAVLFSPYTDLTHSGVSLIANVDTDYLPVPRSADLPPAGTVYVDGADPRHPEASVLFGDPTGLPPLLILAGGREMLLDDATRFAAKATSAGVDVRLHVEPDMFHVWPAVIPDHPASHRALALGAEFVEQRRHPESGVASS